MHEPESENTELLARFYREHILPIAEDAAADGVEIFPLGPDADCESYFIDRKSGESYVHEIDHTNMDEELSRLWSADRLRGMEDLAKPIVQLAESLRDKEVESDDVSPFIYAMF
jgi:hypothetical protein